VKTKSTKSAASLKPYKGYPLTPHRGAKQWCKKHRGDSYYFGPLANWQAALKRFEREWPYIIQGLKPPALADDDNACTLRTLANLFLESKRNKMAAGELTELSYRDYYRSCKRLIDHFGADRRVDDLRPTDFESFRAKLAAGRNKKTWRPTTLFNEVNRCRVILKYAGDQRLIPQPVYFGQSFDRPSKKVQRKARNEAGPRVYTREDLLMFLEALQGRVVVVRSIAKPVKIKADPQLRAMTLLGLNAGLGVTDCANLSKSHINLESGWLDYPRVRTETPRRAPLWPETVEALQVVLAERKQSLVSADDGIVFLTRTRRRWVRTKPGKTPEKNLHLNAISHAFGKVLHALNINSHKGLGFYTLRRQFEIVAGGSLDQVCVDAIMGHVDGTSAAVYRQGVISEERYHAVINHVRGWLFRAAITT
jgi:integrase